jgi:hypothetical protein
MHVCYFSYHRNFTLQTLGRIKTVHPTMYSFQQEKIQLPTLSPVKLKYELTIIPSIELNDLLIVSHLLFFFSADFNIQSNMQITPSMIVERIDCFRRALFNLVKTHHRVEFQFSISYKFRFCLIDFSIRKIAFKT